MNLYEFVKKIDISAVKCLNRDLKEMAVVRKLLIELSQIFYRNTTFFMYKEALDTRYDIYNKQYCLTNIDDFSIVCKSYSSMIKELLKNVFSISSELISPFSDTYRHIDVIVTVKSGKKYIVDPLTSLIEFQSGWRTTKFASEKAYREDYGNSIKNISFLSDEELEIIDEALGYRIGLYVDDFYEFLCDDLQDVEKFLYDNPNLSQEVIGCDFGIQAFDFDSTLIVKLDIISRTVYEGNRLHSIADLIIYIKVMLSKILLQEEFKKIDVLAFWVDSQDIKDRNIFNFFENDENRKRGIIVRACDKIFVYTYDTNKYLKFDEKDWNKLIEKNNIFVKPNNYVSLLGYMKDRNVNRNLLHHSEFLRIFSHIEQLAKEKGVNLLDYLSLSSETVETSLGETMLFSIKNNKLSIINKNEGTEYEVDYLDEGRDVRYKKKEMLNN